MDTNRLRALTFWARPLVSNRAETVLADLQGMRIIATALAGLRIDLAQLDTLELEETLWTVEQQEEPNRSLGWATL